MFEVGRLPVWILERNNPARSAGYRFPIHCDPAGFKLGIMHHRKERVDPDNFERNPVPEDEMFLRD